MQADAGLVRQRDPGAGHAEAALAQAVEEGFVEGAAEALAPGILGDVDRNAGAPAVGGTLVEGGRVGVSDHLSPALGDEPGVAGAVTLIRAAISAPPGARSSKETGLPSTCGA